MNGYPEKNLTWNALLTRTYALYWRNFWTFFRIGMVPALLAFGYRQLSHAALLRATQEGRLGDNPITNVPLMAALGFSDGAIYWSISAFFFAGVASAVLEPPSEMHSPFGDAFSTARQRAGAILGIALLTWTLFYFARAVTGIAMLLLFGNFLRSGNYWVVVLVVSLPLLFLASLLSRFGLTIPVLMHQPRTSWSQAIRQSLHKTENRETFFAIFLAKSAVAAFAAYWLVNIALQELWRRHLVSAPVYPWLDSLISVCIAAALESPFFIAFSVLYRDQQAIEDAFPAAIG